MFEMRLFVRLLRARLMRKAAEDRGRRERLQQRKQCCPRCTLTRNPAFYRPVRCNKPWRWHTLRCSAPDESCQSLACIV